MGFFPLFFRDAVCYDAGTGVEAYLVILNDGGADGDVPLTAAIKAKVADGASVKFAWMLLKLRNDLEGAFLWCATDAATGKTGFEGLRLGDALPQCARDGGDEVIHLREAFHPPEIWRLHAAKLAHLSEVISLEVGDHEQLGTFFFAEWQFAGGGGVTRWVVWKTRSRAFDWPRGDVAALHF